MTRSRDLVRFARDRDGTVWNLDRLIRLRWHEAGHPATNGPYGLATFAGCDHVYLTREEHDDLAAAAADLGML